MLGTKKIRGITTVSMAIAMTVAGLLTLASARYAINKFNENKGVTIGVQLQNVVDALDAYIQKNTTTIITGTQTTADKKTYKSTPSVGELQKQMLLASTASTTPIYGGAFNIRIEVTNTDGTANCTSNCVITGYVHLSDPFLADGQKINLQMLGPAVSASKSNQIGFSSPATPTLISGPGWTVPNPDSAQRAGILLGTTRFTHSDRNWLEPADNKTALPMLQNVKGDTRLATDTGKPYIWTIRSGGNLWEEMFSSNRTQSLSIGTDSGIVNYSTNVSGANNVLIGHQSAQKMQWNATDNTFVGALTGQALTTGHRNVFMGSTAGASSTDAQDNVFIGHKAGASNTVGMNNVFVGSWAGTNNRTVNYSGNGIDNVFLGYSAGQNNTDGYANTFTGSSAGQNNATGTQNVFSGYQSGFLNTTGYNNTFTGTGSGYSNTDGLWNSIHGFKAGYQSNGSYNTFSGAYSGYGLNSDLKIIATGSENTFSGYQSGYRNANGSSNTFAGAYSGWANTSGIENTFTGRSSGNKNTTGNANTFAGAYSGWANTSGIENTFSGRSAGNQNTTGNWNTFSGAFSGYSNMTGIRNTFTGSYSGNNNNIGEQNTFTGHSAGYTNTSGNYNTFTGTYAGGNNKIGNENSFTGYKAGNQNTDGSQNTFSGAYAGYTNTLGKYNTFTGYAAGYKATGSNNTFVGNNAGKSVLTGSWNTYLGADADSTTDVTNATAIGYGATVSESNTIRLGNPLVTKLYIGNAQVFPSSDRRLKQDIVPTARGLEFINRLKPVDYTLIQTQKPSTGFIAQEVEDIDPAFPGLHKPVNEQDFYALSYTDFIPSMVKSIQQLDEKLSQAAATSGQALGDTLTWLKLAVLLLSLCVLGCMAVIYRFYGELRSMRVSMQRLA